MLRYNLTYITVPPTGMNEALSRIEDWQRRGGLRGKFLSCWMADIGALSRILLIHGYERIADVPADREDILTSDNPFGLGELLLSMDTDAYKPIDGLPEIAEGDQGPYFEVRTYHLNANGLPPTLNAWNKAVEPRSRYSKLLSCMFAVGGEVPRIVHIWPYASLDERAVARNKSVAEGAWPPPGAPQHLKSMRSEIFVPAPFSPVK